MTHKRTVIRAALVSAIIGLTTTGPRVFVNPARPLSDADLPALVLRDGAEEVVEHDLDGLPAQTRWKFRLEALSKTVSGIGQIDAITSEVPVALAAAQASFYALDAICDWRGASGELEVDDSTDKPVYLYPLSIEVLYTS